MDRMNSIILEQEIITIEPKYDVLKYIYRERETKREITFK